MGCVPSTQAACYTCPLRYKIFAAYLPQVCLASAGVVKLFIFAAQLHTCNAYMYFVGRYLYVLKKKKLLKVLVFWLNLVAGSAAAAARKSRCCSDAPSAVWDQSRAASARSAFGDALGGAGT